MQPSTEEFIMFPVELNKIVIWYNKNKNIKLYLIFDFDNTTNVKWNNVTKNKEEENI